MALQTRITSRGSKQRVFQCVSPSVLRFSLALLPLSASAAPLLVGDHATLTEEMNGGLVATVHYKYQHKPALYGCCPALQLAVLPVLAALPVSLLAVLLRWPALLSGRRKTGLEDRRIHVSRDHRFVIS
jgi:hypothetical protein